QGAGSVLRVGAVDPVRIAAVLELDPDRERVDAVATGASGDRRRRAQDAAGMMRRVSLGDELGQPSVEPDEIVGADTALGAFEPGGRGVKAPGRGVDDDRAWALATPAGLAMG